ncbi:hypothetical protein AGMMS49546_04770 [Spirochaetia bacterium]|nr:hypothetical protein AGMMS49546_04770 [Spirochaetia bacterium]
MGKKPFSLLWDYLFGLIFGDQRNIGITTAFLKALPGLTPEEYGKLTVVNPILKRMWKKDKMAVVDVRINTKSGRVIHVEMQAAPYKFMRNRLMYYLSKLLWEQLKRGYEYGRLHQVISILICDHELIPETAAYINEWELRNRETGQIFTDLVKIITIELPKVPQGDNGEPEWGWLRLFKCKEIKELKMLARNHPELGEAVSIIERLNWPRRIRMYLEWKRLNRYDWENIVQYQIELAQEKIAEAEKMKYNAIKNFREMGLSFEQIAQGLNSTPEEVEKKYRGDIG